ncbi:DNA-binding response regulator [Clostridium sp. chh4-2]|nr:LytTR family DNA-binding domain-containing protein [Clostridium sp. chh4-2]PNV60922.1 DNA-binding response regulator [Clostridium sp. chh4-2]
MKIAIVDDLSMCRADIQDCVERYLREHYDGEMPFVEQFASGEEFLAGFQAEFYDIIFIDQFMSGLSGMDTARRIREKDEVTALVFITTSRDYAIDSYGVRASGYLVKPYSYLEFAKAMDNAGLEKIRNARFICLEGKKILLREILWCSLEGHYLQIHTEKRGILRFRVAMRELSILLEPYIQFLNCYKGCIVNMERVACMGKLDFQMVNGEKVPFSKRDRKKIESLYHAYIFRRERMGGL